MADVQEHIWWLVGLSIFMLVFIVSMLMRNRAAKTDRVLHTKDDTVKDSVSIKPKDNTTKLL